MPQKKLLTGKIQKKSKRKITRDAVLKVLKAVMDKQETAPTEGEHTVNQQEIQNEFYTTGRIGRRNAMPDILAEHCTTSTADLPENFSALTTQDPTKSSTTQPGPSAPETEVSSNKA